MFIVIQVLSMLHSKEENSKWVGLDLCKWVILFTFLYPGHFKKFKDRTIWSGCSYIGEHYSVIFISGKAFYFITCPMAHSVTHLKGHHCSSG